MQNAIEKCSVNVLYPHYPCTMEDIFQCEYSKGNISHLTYSLGTLYHQAAFSALIWQGLGQMKNCTQACFKMVNSILLAEESEGVGGLQKLNSLYSNIYMF